MGSSTVIDKPAGLRSRVRLGSAIEIEITGGHGARGVAQRRAVDCDRTNADRAAPAVITLPTSRQRRAEALGELVQVEDIDEPVTVEIESGIEADLG
jgi:hypothetical protein